MDLKKLISQNVNKFLKQNRKIPVAIKLLIYFHVLLLWATEFIYLAYWLITAYFGLAKPPDLLALIDKLISGGMLAMLGGLAAFFVDLNGNGIPDKLEQKERGERNV